MNRLESIGGHAVSLSDLMKMSDIVISTTGVKNLIKPEMIKKGQVILALSNPEPEIEPEVAMAQGASFAVDGKSVNNVLGFPGIFKGALKAKAKKITKTMLIAAAQSLSEQASGSYLVPEPLNRSVHEHVTEAVYQAAKAESTNQSGSLYER
jgi:malate dehydrogenase (oxaloacetate-decarboxylating)